MEFQVEFLSFLIIDGFEWFWMRSLLKFIQLMPEFLDAPLVVLYFSYYRLMTFLMMSSVILLSVLMMLLSTTSELWQKLELTSELASDLRDTVDWTRKWHVDFNAGKVSLCESGWVFLKKNHLLR